MQVIISTDQRFYRTPDGSVWTHGQYENKFWLRYLDVFDVVSPIARIVEVETREPNWLQVDGKGVSVIPLPNYVGPWGYLTNSNRLRNKIRNEIGISKAAFILRFGSIGHLLGQSLISTKYPYAVEVICDPWDAFAPGTMKSITRSPVRFLSNQDLKQQCANACACSYVTNQVLQERFPCTVNALSVNCSDVQLDNEAYLERSLDSFLQKEKIRILNVGSMEMMYKAQDVQLKALKILLERGYKAELVLVGDGKYRQYFEQLTSSLELNDDVIFVGSLPGPAAVRKELDKADLFILPSRAEGQPRVLLEAMARSLPCIGTDVGGIGELLSQDELVSVNSEIDLADHICKIINNPERIDNLSQRNFVVSKQYSQENIKAKRVEFYKHLLNETKKYLNLDCV